MSHTLKLLLSSSQLYCHLHNDEPNVSKILLAVCKTPDQLSGVLLRYSSLEWGTTHLRQRFPLRSKVFHFSNTHSAWIFLKIMCYASLFVQASILTTKQQGFHRLSHPFNVFRGTLLRTIQSRQLPAQSTFLMLLKLHITASKY